MYKIGITGTKGKTTVSNVLAMVFQKLEDQVLHVDTNGAYLNGKLAISKLQSQQIWDVVPTVAPGRFLYLLAADAAFSDESLHHGTIPGVAVLEESLGCGTNSGLGYYGHDVGVFTNVFEDHLGSRPDLNSREDIGKSKRFVLARINRDGAAVVNADDDVVVDNIQYCKEGVTLLPFGLTFKHFNLKAHLEAGGTAFTVKNQQVVLLKKNKEEVLLNVQEVEWTFDGLYQPSIYNLLAVIATLYAYSNNSFPEPVRQALLESRLDPYTGRLARFKTDKGVQVLADYAHEKQSLRSIAELAHQLKTSSENKVIGVLRLSWDRTEELVKETAEYIANDYDSFVIYEKIDGFWRQPSSRFRTGQRQFTQEVGKISNWFYQALIKKRGEKNIERIMREDEALQKAAAMAKPGDVVVFIVNDNINRSLDFVKKSFEIKEI